MSSRSEDKRAETPTFVARFWLETGPQEELLWRGRVKHVQGDREAYFASLSELRAFLEEISGVPAPADGRDRGDKPGANR